MNIFRSFDRKVERHAAGLGHSPRREAAQGGDANSLGVDPRHLHARAWPALWICQGLAEWALVLLPGQTVFDTLPSATSAAVIFFAIADLVAAVGLWLATPWGGALWLFAATSQIFVAVVIRNSISVAWIVIDVTLIAVYFVLTFKAGQSSEPIYERSKACMPIRCSRKRSVQRMSTLRSCT